MISVIIPTYNRQESLKKCLDSIFQIDYSDYEVIVVNDGSTDGTKEFLEKYKQKHSQLKALHLDKNYGPSVARNKGIEIAQGEIIAFTDDDCIVDKNWLREIVKSFKKNIIGVSGLIYYCKNNKIFYPKKRFLWDTANVAYLKKALIEINGFDPFFKRCGDADLFLKIVKKFKENSIERNEKAIIYHLKDRPVPEKILTQRVYYQVWLIKRHGRSVKKYGINILFNFIIAPKDYLSMSATPFLIIYHLLSYPLIEYIVKKKQDKLKTILKKIFFPFLKRYYIWKAAWEAKIFLI